MSSVFNRGTKERPNWWARIKVGKNWVSRPTHASTVGGARVIAEEKQRRADRGEPIDETPDPGRKPAHRLTLNDLIDRVLKEYHRGRIKDIDRWRIGARTGFKSFVRPYLGERIAVSVRRADVMTWLGRLREDGYSPGTCNNALGWLQLLYTWANTMEIIDCRSPAARIERTRVPSCQDRLALDEIHKVLSAPDCPVMLRTALYTGMRKGELFGLTWACVHLDGEYPYIDVRHNYRRTPKSGKPRLVPIASELLPVLRLHKEQCPPTAEGLVFPVALFHGGWAPAQQGWRMGKQGDMEGIQEALGAAGCRVPARPWHAMRHTFISVAIEARMARDAVEMIAGHASHGSATTSAYIHVGLPYLSSEMAKLHLLPPAPAGVASLDEHRRQRAAAK